MLKMGKNSFYQNVLFRVLFQTVFGWISELCQNE